MRQSVLASPAPKLSPAQKAWATRRAKMGGGHPPTGEGLKTHPRASLRTYESVSADLRAARHALALFNRLPAGPQRNAALKRGDRAYDQVAKLQNELAALSPSPAPEAATAAPATIYKPAPMSCRIEWRTSPMSEADHEAMAIPAFLQRSAKR